MDECLFCKIVKGEIPSKKIYEDDNTVAFLDINPANPGHALVVPKEHAENINDISEASAQNCMLVAKKIAEKMYSNLGIDGINIIQNNGQHAGQIVVHFHIHVVPRYENDKVMIGLPRNQTDEASLNEIQSKLNISEKVSSSSAPEKKPEPKKEEFNKEDLDRELGF